MPSWSPQGHLFNNPPIMLNDLLWKLDMVWDILREQKGAGYVTWRDIIMSCVTKMSCHQSLKSETLLRVHKIFNWNNFADCEDFCQTWLIWCDISKFHSYLSFCQAQGQGQGQSQTSNIKTRPWGRVCNGLIHPPPTHPPGNFFWAENC